MKVLKFGGSSVADATNISKVMDIVEKAAAGDRVILVCSAVSGCTDALLELSRTGRGSEERDALLEALRIRHNSIVRRLFTGVERYETEEVLNALFADLSIAPEDEMVTFGELLSTTIIARKLTCEGIRTKWLDSRILVIKDNKTLTYNNISTAVALEPDIQVFVAPGFIASEYNGKVTTLGRGGSDFSAALFAAAVKAEKLEIWTDVPGIMTANPKDVPAARTIPRISYGAALDMAEHGAKVLYAPTVAPAMEAGISINILNTFDPANPGTVVCEMPENEAPAWIGLASMGGPSQEESTICLVGAGGEAVSERIEDCLRKAGIGTLSINPVPGHVLVRVRKAVEKNALKVLHREFFESAAQSVVDLYIAGRGAVGTALVQLIKDSADSIATRTGKILRIAGFSSDRSFAPGLAAKASRGSVFVDVTDSEDIYKEYEGLLREGINIVSSNRRALAVPFVEFAAMHAAAMENGVFLRYETTVGSALPVLESIAAGANSSDEIISLEAVVSCTLNEILTSYDYSPASFSSIVRKAQDEGLTEPDPRLDLSGREALRKLLILAREAGVPLEEGDVDITPVVGPEYFGIPLEEFYDKLEAAEPVFKAREAEADAKGCHQRFVASLEKDPASPKGYKASIGLRLVDENHPAYRITGTENAIIIKSAYHPYPLLIQGAGEGARLAASSVLNDILR